MFNLQMPPSSTTKLSSGGFPHHCFIYVQLSTFPLGPYNRKDPNFLKAIDILLETGKSPDDVYIANYKNEHNPNKIVDLKTIHNRQYQLKKGVKVVDDQNEVKASIEFLKQGHNKSIRYCNKTPVHRYPSAIFHNERSPLLLCLQCTKCQHYI